MTVGGRGSLSPRSAPLSVGYCIYSRGALLSSHLPSPLLMGGGQLSWNHGMGENLVWPTWCLGTPVRPRGWGGLGGSGQLPLSVFGGMSATQRGHSLQRGGYDGSQAPCSGDKLWRGWGGEVQLPWTGPGL